MTGASIHFEKPSGLKTLLVRFPFLPAFCILIMLFILNGISEPRSLSFSSVTGLVSTYLALMFLAMAQTYVVFTGDIDLSNGTILSLVNVVVISLMEYTGDGLGSILFACLIGLLTGLVCGFLNGLIVAGLRLQSIVATFATSILFTGVALFIMPVAGTPAPEAFWVTYSETYFGIPFVFYILAGILALAALLSRTRLQIELLAVGDGHMAAYQSGLPVTLIRIKGYMLCGLFSAMAALCISGATASGDPLVGSKMTLLSIAAVVLGGTALAGGFGTVVGSLIGALILGLIESFVYFAGTPSEWQTLVKGIAILAALMIGIFVSRSAKGKEKRGQA